MTPNPEVNDNEKGYNWLVQGFENETGRTFQYRCKKVVLATGTTDSSNRLGIPGEKTHSDWVTHNLNMLESKLDQLVSSQSKKLSILYFLQKVHFVLKKIDKNLNRLGYNRLVMVHKIKINKVTSAYIILSFEHLK